MARLTVLLASAVFAATAARAAAPLTPVHIAPVPGVTFDLPHGWIACDDATNALLGDAADPRDLKDKVCVKPNGDVTFKFRAFNPLLFRNISMLIDQHEQQDISATDLASITPEVATAIAPQVCPIASKPLTGDGTTIESCTLAVDTFAGHQALHSVIVAVPPNLPEGKYQVDIYELPYSKGYLQVQFNSPVLFKGATKAEMSAIIASFTIE
ncbi:MAG TPA: hypothetical protein VHZ78_13965 [Rhizomicrobium sp.]|jgi:hypothetical protein|nr:hypothetical protein [Rhizomicrobium sp.]